MPGCPNGWRLSGDGGEADGVRFSRGLGDPERRVEVAKGASEGVMAVWGAGRAVS
jgi:hypothetical protein